MCMDGLEWWGVSSGQANGSKQAGWKEDYTFLPYTQRKREEQPFIIRFPCPIRPSSIAAWTRLHNPSLIKEQDAHVRPIVTPFFGRASPLHHPVSYQTPHAASNVTSQQQRKQQKGKKRLASDFLLCAQANLSSKLYEISDNHSHR